MHDPGDMLYSMCITQFLPAKLQTLHVTAVLFGQVKLGLGNCDKTFNEYRKVFSLY